MVMIIYWPSSHPGSLATLFPNKSQHVACTAAHLIGLSQLCCIDFAVNYKRIIPSQIQVLWTRLQFSLALKSNCLLTTFFNPSSPTPPGTCLPNARGAYLMLYCNAKHYSYGMCITAFCCLCSLRGVVGVQ